MATFTVWKFDSPDGADNAVSVLKGAQSERLITILDHAVVSWPADRNAPRTSWGHEDEKRGTGWGALWGTLVGTLFFMPLLGAAAGAAIGMASKATAAVGLNKEQLERISQEVTPGSSALFVVTDQGDTERVGERFHGLSATLVATNLTEAERQVLLETFGD